MQRAAQKEEKPKEEEPKLQGNFGSPSNVSRKCVVVMEGDPHPGTIRGRMSFQNFNPSVDKLNDDAANGHEAEASTSSSCQNGRNFDRGNGPLEPSDMDTGNSDGELKRKQPEAGSQTSHPKKLQKKTQVKNQPSPSENRSSQKQSKRDKLNWNVLMPPKSQSRKQ